MKILGIWEIFQEKSLYVHILFLYFSQGICFCTVSPLGMSQIENLNRKLGKLGNRSEEKSNYKDGKSGSKGHVKGSEICKTLLEMPTAP